MSQNERSYLLDCCKSGKGLKVLVIWIKEGIVMIDGAFANTLSWT